LSLGVWIKNSKLMSFISGANSGVNVHSKLRFNVDLNSPRKIMRKRHDDNEGIV
jgi:hypothetical protein